MIVSSNEYLVWIDGTAVPDVQTVALSYTLSTLEVTTQPTGGYKESVADTRTVTITFDAILDSVNLNRFNIGDNVAIRFGTLINSFEADAGYINDIQQNAGTDSISTYSVSIEITGDVTEVLEIMLLALQINGEDVTINGGQILIGTIIN